MLVVRITEETNEGRNDERSSSNNSTAVLSTGRCQGAADTQRAFVESGTVLQHINGTARLMRLEPPDRETGHPKKDVGQEPYSVAWGGRRNSSERRDVRDPSAAVPVKATPIVFLPAIPSHLPLWGLLSPPDAARSRPPDFDITSRRVDDATDATDLLSSTKIAAAKEPPPSPTGLSNPATTTNNNSTQDAHGKNCSESVKMAPRRNWLPSETLTVSPTTTDRFNDSHHESLEHDANTTTDAVVAAVGDPNRQPESRKGAVRLLRIITAASVPYRYAAVLYFWKTADAASFVDRFTGLSLPQGGVLKTLFLAEAALVASHTLTGIDGNDRTAASRRYRRRSLSEGVNLAAAVATGAAPDNSTPQHTGSGAEESKSSWPGGTHSRISEHLYLQRSSSNPLLLGRDKGLYTSIKPSPLKQNIEHDISMMSIPPSPAPLSLQHPLAEEKLGMRAPPNAPALAPGAALTTSGVEGVDMEGRTGASERKGVQAERASADGGSPRGGSVSPPPPPLLLSTQQSPTVVLLSLNGPSTGPGKRRPRPWTESRRGEGGDVIRVVDDAGFVGGAGGGGGGGWASGRGRGTELPPCPVCLDRLDPAISGVPSARRRNERGAGGVAAVEAGGGGHRGFDGWCHHSNSHDDGHYHRDRVCGGSGDGDGNDEGKAYSPARGGEGEALATDGGTTSEGSSSLGKGLESNNVGLRALNVRGGGSLGLPVSGGGNPDPWSGAGPGAPGVAAAGGGRGEGDKVVGSVAVKNEVMWTGSTCRVCRSLNVALEGAPDVELHCETCRIAHNLWICMVCGHIGCGRYTEEHAARHFHLFRHSYSLELSTGRVWDYVGDCYAHRALRGHLAPLQGGQCYLQAEGGRYGGARAVTSPRSGRGGGGGGGGAGGGWERRDAGPPLYSEGGFDGRGEVGRSGDGGSDSLKVAVVSREYEALVARQLQEQQRYFEGLIATAVSANAEANAPAGDAMSEAERQEVGRLRKEVDAFSLQHEGILDSLRAAEEAARSVRAENRTLLMQQRAQKEAISRLKNDTLQTKRKCEAQMVELEGQMQDLMFFLKAQQEVEASPQREELVGGSVVMGAGGPSSSRGSSSGAVDGRAGGRRETERKRLAKLLKERSNTRRARGES